jgi:hypothetical protein
VTDNVSKVTTNSDESEADIYTDYDEDDDDDNDVAPGKLSMDGKT